MHALIGATIGNYVVQGKIGEGGMGVVYVAEHPRIGRKVAIKVLLPEYSQNEEVVSRFFTEARASSAIKNEHIIDIIDFGELPDKASYIIMEWLEGEPLSRVLDREGMLELPRALHIARGIGKALAAAHARNIVHRDLKPDNVFLIQRGDDNDFVKVLDFGIAKLLGNEAGAPGVDAKQVSAKTRTGSIIGTPTYMSPEQCRGVAVDARSDIYSLGVMVYQMIVGRVPFEAEGLGDLLLKHMTEAPRPLRELAPAVPEAIEHAVLRALEKDPAQRYASVADFVRDLGTPITTVLAASRSTEMPIVTPTAARAAAVGSIDTIGGASGEAVSSPPAQRARGGAWMIAVPVVLVGVGVLALTLRNGGDHPDRTDHKDAVKPAVAVVEPVSPTPMPPPSKPPAPATVRFAVRTLPATAHLLVNGVEQHNPYVVDVAADGTAYDLQIDAPGFVPYHNSVKVDRQQDLEIVLEAKKGTVAHGSRPPSLPKPPPTTDHAEAPTHVAAPKDPVSTTPAVPTANDAKKDDRTYKGTKGTLITDYPESK